MSRRGEYAMKNLPIYLVALVAGPAMLSCDGQPTQPSDIRAPADVIPSALLQGASSAVTAESEITLKFDPHNFVRVVDNRFFPLQPGTRWVYKGVEDGEEETNVTIVTHDRKEILGVSTIVVFDRVFLASGELKEKTFDFYAQDKEGNVWYMGENTKELENGRVVSTEGTWQAGRNGAKAGIIMLAHPQIGDQYRQEFLAGEAEDEARVVARGLDIKVPFGSFHNCIKTVEWTRLEPGVKEAKVNCPDVGFVKAAGIEGPATRLVLTDITHVSR
jgi:hypothetical protein